MKTIILTIITFCLIGSTALAQNNANDFDVSLYANYWGVKDATNEAFGPGISIGIPLAHDLAFNTSEMRDVLKLDVAVAWFSDVNASPYLELELVPLDVGLSYHYIQCDMLDLSVMGGISYVFANSDSDFPDDEVDVDIDGTIGGYVGVGAGVDLMENISFFSNVYFRFAHLDADIRQAEFGNYEQDDKFNADGLNVDMGIAYKF